MKKSAYAKALDVALAVERALITDLRQANKIAVDRATKLQLEIDAARAEIARLKGASK